MSCNIDAWDLWIEIQTQWRAGPAGIIGLDYHAVYAEAKRIEIELSICTMKKIKMLEQLVLENISKDN